MARVGDTVVTELDVAEAMRALQPTAVFHGASVATNDMELHDSAVAYAIDEELFLHDALRRGLKVDPETVRARMASAAARVGGQAALETALGTQGFSMEAYAARIERRLLIDLYTQEQLGGPIEVTDEDLATAFEQRQHQYMTPPAVRIKFIYLRVDPAATADERAARRQLADALHQRVEAGEPLDQLVLHHSDNLASLQTQGGSLVRRGELEAVLDAAIFALEPGQTTAPVETLHGWMIVRVDEKLPACPQPLHEVAGVLRAQLASEKRLARRDALADALRRDFSVEVLGVPSAQSAQ